MNAEELANLVKANTESEIELAHVSWRKTQAGINTMLGQLAMLRTAKLTDMFFANAAMMNGIPATGEPLEETVRGMIKDKPPSSTDLTTSVVVTPPATPTLVGKPTNTLAKTIGAVLLGTGLGAGGLALGNALLNPTPTPATVVGDSQANFRYNYLEERGMHLPPENDTDG